MVAPQVFKVLTEFNFEIGGAMLSSKSLQGEVQKLSSAADNALLSFQRLGMGVAANFGLLGGGVLGFMGTAIRASEKFLDAQTALIMNISSISDKLTGPIDTYGQRALVAKNIIGDLVKVSREFAISEYAMFGMTKLLVPVLGQFGALGNNFENAVDLARNVLKAAPLLGLDPTLIQGQLIDIVTGASSGQGRLWERLVGETPQFAKFAKRGGVAEFNILPAAKRVQLLRDALFRFTKDTEALDARVNSLNGQMTILKSLIMGFDSILRPLGDVLKKPLIKMLQTANTILQTEGKRIVANLAKFIDSIVKEPERLIINLQQTSRLAGDVRKTGNFLKLTAGLFLLGHALRFLGVQSRIVTFMLSPLTTTLVALSRGLGILMTTLLNPLKLIGAAASMGSFLVALPGLLLKVGSIFLKIGGVLASFLIPAAMFLAVLQTISRAIAIARVADVKAMPAFVARITALFNRLTDALSLIVMPITNTIDYFARLISPLFRVMFWGDLVISTIEGLVLYFEKLAGLIAATQAAISGFFEAFFQMILNAMDIYRNQGLMGFAREGATDKIFGNLDEAFAREFNRFILGFGKGREGEDGAAVVQQKVEVGKVEIRNEFREKQEPDRIAFTIKDQLSKAAMNPTQGRGRTSSRGLVTSFAATQ